MNSSSSKVAAYRCSPSSPRRTVMSRSPPSPTIAHRGACNVVHKLLRAERPANSAPGTKTTERDAELVRARRRQSVPFGFLFRETRNPVHSLLVLPLTESTGIFPLTRESLPYPSALHSPPTHVKATSLSHSSAIGLWKKKVARLTWSPPIFLTAAPSAMARISATS